MSHSHASSDTDWLRQIGSLGILHEHYETALSLSGESLSKVHELSLTDL